MSKIRVMDEHLSNKIAAGEVVEKCVSIVKELVENSIDAKASEIKIELKEAGLREIKIIDDGIGMDKEDALLAFQRHATSKLYTDDDLFSINSLGFRGEALPSIASVSEVILKTCQNDIGTLIHIKGGKILENTNSEARQGTSITVSNLFFNTPARLKHLSSYYTELSNIIDYVNKMALSYPSVKFILTNDDKELLNTDGSGNLLKVIKAIYGADIARKMIKVECSNDDYEVDGYISLPEVNRSNRNYISILVNGRVVRNTILNRVINDAYQGFKEESRYPIVVLNLTTDPSLVDVNIHPAKLDIKFSNFEDLQIMISEMIKEALRNKLLIPKIEIKEKNNWFNKQETSNITIYIPENKIFERTEIEAGAGEINIDKLQTNNLTFSIGAGKVQINELEVFEKAEIEGGAGKADIISGELHNLDLEMGLGELNLTTKLIGNNVIEQGIGKLSINLTDNIENYKIRTSKGLGSITIDGNEVQDGNTYGNGENNIRIEGGMGAIEIVTNSPEGQSI